MQMSPKESSTYVPWARVRAVPPDTNSALQLATINRSGVKFFRSAGLDVDILLSETLPLRDGESIAVLHHPMVAESRLVAMFVVLRTMAAHFDGEKAEWLATKLHALEKLAFSNVIHRPGQSSAAAVFEGQVVAPALDSHGDDEEISASYKVRPCACVFVCVFVCVQWLRSVVASFDLVAAAETSGKSTEHVAWVQVPAKYGRLSAASSKGRGRAGGHRPRKANCERRG